MDEELMDGLGMTEVRPGRSRAVEADDDGDFDVSQRPGLAVEALVRGMGPELLPGAGERVLKRFGAGSPDGGIRAAVNFLHDPHNCEGVMNPEIAQPNIAPLRRLIRRFEQAGLLQKGAADELYDNLAIDIHPDEMRRDPGRVAVKVWDALHDPAPERRMLWCEASRPPLGHRQARVAQALDALGVSFGPSRTEELCFKWKDAAEGSRPFDEVVRIVAKRLAWDGIQVRPEAVAAAIGAASPGPSPADFRAAHARAVGYERM